MPNVNIKINNTYTRMVTKEDVFLYLLLTKLVSKVGVFGCVAFRDTRIILSESMESPIHYEYQYKITTENNDTYEFAIIYGKGDGFVFVCDKDHCNFIYWGMLEALTHIFSR